MQHLFYRTFSDEIYNDIRCSRQSIIKTCHKINISNSQSNVSVTPYRDPPVKRGRPRASTRLFVFPLIRATHSRTPRFANIGGISTNVRCPHRISALPNHFTAREEQKTFWGGFERVRQGRNRTRRPKESASSKRCKMSEGSG